MLDFIGIGAQKSGTTWFYENLSKHPNICFPAGKEIHFWDVHYSRGLDWYKSLFSHEHYGSKQGEITPAYAILSIDLIKQIKIAFPELRIFFVIRNPLHRAWSSALMALKRAEMTVEEASDQWFIDHFQSRGSLQRGDYATCITNWRKVFSPEQILIIRFEKIKLAPSNVLKLCCRHIGANPSLVDMIPHQDLCRTVFSGSNYALRESLFPILLELYRPRILKLEEVLRENFGDWLTEVKN